MTNEITKKRRDAIRAAAAKATPGPWEPRHDDEVWGQTEEGIGQHILGAAFETDAIHIANCDPQTILALLDALDAAEAKMGEPVAWRWRDDHHYWFTEDADMADRKSKTGFHAIPLFAAPTAAEPVIPEGWVLVPREPTQEQAEAGRAAHAKRFPEEPISDISAAEILRAGIAAAPALVSEKEAE